MKIKIEVPDLKYKEDKYVDPDAVMGLAVSAMRDVFAEILEKCGLDSFGYEVDIDIRAIATGEEKPFVLKRYSFTDNSWNVDEGIL